MTDPLFDRIRAAIGDQYDIEAEVGRGAVGVVYAARDLRLRRRVAVKVLPPDLAFRGDVRTRFLREAETAAGLSHPNIVPIYDVGERDGLVYFVMALVEGGSLARCLQSDPRPPVAVVQRILAHVADALSHAHERGIVHRDIKPDNILLDGSSGRALVTDFGIARAAEGDQRMTATGSTIGSPAYMSPEQALGDHDLDGRSDIYSLGVVGYQMLAGEPPFRAATAPAMLMKHVSETPRPLRELRADAPPALVSAVELAMEKRAEHRWPSAEAFRDALTRPADANAPRRPPRPAPQAPTHTGTRPRVAPAAAQPAAPLPQPTPIDPRDFAASPASFDEIVRSGPTPGFGALLKPISGTLASRLGGFLLILFLFGLARAPWILFVVILLTMTIGMAKVGGWVVRGVADLLTGGRVSAAAAAAEGDPSFVQSVVRSPAPAAAEATLRSEYALPGVLRDRGRSGEVAAVSAQQAKQSLLYGEYVHLVRNAMEEKKAIVGAAGALSPEDRAMLPPVVPTATALSDRVCSLAQALHRIDATFDGGTVAAVEARLERARGEPAGAERDSRVNVLERQRESALGLARRRDDMRTQLDSSMMALMNLKLDMLRLSSEGLGSVLSDVASATQEARALSREIGRIVDAAGEVKRL